MEGTEKEGHIIKLLSTIAETGEKRPHLRFRRFCFEKLLPHDQNSAVHFMLRLCFLFQEKSSSIREEQ
jgi:hypothetical protein